MTAILTIHMAIPGTSYKAETIFSTLLIIKNRFQSTMLGKKLNYLCILFMGNITKVLSYAEGIKKSIQSKKVEENSNMEGCRAVH